MSKMFTARWLGDGDPAAQIITEGGVRFIKDEPTKVPDDLMFNGMPWAQAIKDNPTFAIDGDDEEANGDEEAEADLIREDLDKRGIAYRKNASLSVLRDTLAKADAQ